MIDRGFDFRPKRIPKSSELVRLVGFGARYDWLGSSVSISENELAGIICNEKGLGISKFDLGQRKC
jgi:hypothetical protein